MSVDEQIKRQIQLNSYLWRNRRRMAWGAFVSIIVVTILCFFVVDIERLKVLETVVTWFYMAMASIVGAYMGFATYASVTKENFDIWGPQQSDQAGNLYGPPPDSSIVPDNPDEPVTPRRRVPKVGFE